MAKSYLQKAIIVYPPQLTTRCTCWFAYLHKWPFDCLSYVSHRLILYRLIYIVVGYIFMYVIYCNMLWFSIWCYIHVFCIMRYSKYRLTMTVDTGVCALNNVTSVLRTLLKDDRNMLTILLQIWQQTKRLLRCFTSGHPAIGFKLIATRLQDIIVEH